MAYPTLSVQIAFADDPLDTSPTWTDVTAYVRSISTTSGRARELEPFDVGTATVTLDNSDRRFDPLHTAGPHYGDLLPNKRIRIRATHDATTYDVWYGWIDGWPQSYADDGEVLVAVPCSDAFKLLARNDLPDSVYEVTVLDDEPWLWWRFQDTAGSSVADASGNDRVGTITSQANGWENVDRPPTPIQDPTSVFATQVPSGASWFIGQDVLEVAPSTEFTIEAWIMDEGIDAFTYYAWVLAEVDAFQTGTEWAILLGGLSSTYAERIIVGDRGTVTDHTRTTSDVVNDGKAHHVVVRCDDGTVTVYVDGSAVFTTTAGTPPVSPSYWRWYVHGPVGSAATSSVPTPRIGIGEFAVYPRLLSALEILGHYNAALTPWDGDTTGARVDRILNLFSWPAALKDTDAGLTTLGAARLERRNQLDYLRALTAAEQGQLFCDHRNGGKVTFRERHHRATNTRSITSQATLSDENTGGVYHYADLDLTYDEREIVNAVDVQWLGGVVTVTDDASIATYGRSGRTVETEMSSRAQAKALGEWIIGRYATPTVRCRKVTFDAAAYQTAFGLLDLRINDRVTVRRLPSATGSAFEVDLIVEGIAHEIDDGVNDWTITLYVSQADAGPWWLAGISAPDDETRPVW